MADAVADAVAVVGANKGQEGLLKPADIIKFEADKAAQPPIPPVTQTATPPAPPPTVPPGAIAAPAVTPPGTPPATPAPITPLTPYTKAEVDALLVKIDTGVQLTPDETAMAAAISRVEELSAPPTPPPSTVTYKIGDRMYNDAEIRQVFRQDTGIRGTDISKDVEDKLLQMWYKAQNRTEFSQTVTQNAEALAHERNRITGERVRVEQQAILVRQQMEDLKRTKTELEAIAALSITEADIDDPATGRPNYVKLTQYQQKVAAEQGLANIARREQELQRQQSETSQNQLRIEIESVVAAHPQFKTNGNLLEVWDKLLRQETIASAEDRLRVLELHDLFNAARIKGISVEDEFALRASRPNGLAHPDRPVQPANGGAAALVPDLSALSKTWAEKVRAHRRRLEAAPPATPAPGGTPHVEVPPPIPVAQSLIKEDNLILGNGAQDPFLKSLGYNQT